MQYMIVYQHSEGVSEHVPGTGLYDDKAKAERAAESMKKVYPTAYVMSKDEWDELDDAEV